MKKKLIAGVLAASMCLTMAACDKPDFEDSTVIDPNLTTTVAPTPTGTTAGTDFTTATDTTAETTTVKPETPIVSQNIYDLEKVQVGKYITFMYNAASADVKWDVQKGVGTRETVTFTVTMRDGYLMDGWSEKDAVVNGKEAISKELTYQMSVSSATKLYLNTSIQLVYHANGGEIAKAGFDGTDTFSVVFHQNPNTLPEQGYFKRDGYLLTGYNTKADGTGEAVSLGSKVSANGEGKIELYCVWEPFAPETDFEVRAAGSNVYITKYLGTNDNVVVPETIGGKKVVGLGYASFEMTAVKRVVVPSTVKEIEEDAFYKCTELETLVLFDTIQKISDVAFERCDKFTDIRLNTTKTLIDDWFSSTAAKIDRLIWAKDKKKIIIIGGSGSLYGFNSAVIDEALNGEYEIINLGENANITSIVYFDIVEDLVNEGDIVLWCPEPGSYTLGNPACSTRFWEFRKSNYDFTKYINIQHYKGLLSSFGSFSTSLASRKFKDYDKLSTSMTKYGDDMGNRDSKGQSYNYNFNYGFGGKDAITEIVANMTAKGVKVFYSFAAMQESGMKNVNEKDVLAMEELVTSVPGIVSISDYHDLILEDQYFYDSAWHLTDEGSTVRSEQVAKDLLAALGKS